MNILIACEFSGRVRDTFRAIGHNAISCDLEATETPGPHFVGDVARLLHLDWDMMIAFPPCTHLCTSGSRYFPHKEREQLRAVEFFMLLALAPIPRIAIENPVGMMSVAYRAPDQIIQPWQFGHGESKATCLWLKNLPLLTPTAIVRGRKQIVHSSPDTKDRWKNRSRTYNGIAEAMARQWGTLPEGEQRPLAERDHIHPVEEAT